MFGLWCDLCCFLCRYIFVRVQRNIIYFVHPYPCQYGEPADLLSICDSCKTFPLLGQEGAGPSLLPSKYFLLLKAIQLYFYSFIRSVQNAYMLYHMGHVNCSCEGNERKSTCSGCIGELGQSPAPSPSSVTRSRWGGGGGMAGRVFLGDSERGRGFSGKSIPRAGIALVKTAGWSRTWVRQVISASQLGKPFRHINSAGFFGRYSVGFWMKLKQRKEE